MNENEIKSPYESAVSIPRRVMVLFFVVDTSGSMSGSKIGAVNNAIEEVLPVVQEISDDNADSEIKIAIMQFDTDVKWLTDSPIPAGQYFWNDITAGGLTHLGAACKELNKKLSRKEGGFMTEAVGSFAPVLFLLSDGAPNDDYRAGIELLKNNAWFNAGTKIAIAIGEDADKSVLAEFTGDMESVITVHTPQELKKWIKFVSVTASKIGSNSSNTDKSKQELIDEAIGDAVEKQGESGTTIGYDATGVAPPPQVDFFS